jgi:hypothetical protein
MWGEKKKKKEIQNRKKWTNKKKCGVGKATVFSPHLLEY